jgi:hypothetical protein
VDRNDERRVLAIVRAVRDDVRAVNDVMVRAVSQGGAALMTIKGRDARSFALLNSKEICAKDVFCTCKVLENSYHFGNSVFRRSLTEWRLL